MSFVVTKSRFHVALDGQGLLLQGAPDRLSYEVKQAPIYNQRFGEGDRSYTDFSFWWFFAQTDWSGGIKDAISWADDARFYWSTNINTWDESGGITLSRKPVEDEVFTESLYGGCVAEVGGSTYKFIGTNDDVGDSRPNLYRSPVGLAQTWTEIFGTNIDTNQNLVSQVYGRNGYLWILTVGVGSGDVVNTYSGSVFSDQSALISGAITGGALTYPLQSSRCGCEYQGINYIFVDNASNDQFALVKNTLSNPTVAADYTKVFEKLNNSGLPIDALGFNGTILYMVDYGVYVELWQWNLTSSVNTLLRRFNGTSVTAWALGGKLLIEKDGKVVITAPSNEIWELTSSGILTRLFQRDTFKKSTLSGIFSETSAYLTRGGVLADNKIWWGNLMYDGTRFYNTWKDVGDSTATNHYPIFADLSDNVWFSGSVDDKKLYYVDFDGADYKGTADKNYLVFSNFDLVSGIDKLAYSLTILFKPLITGQSIDVEYYLGEMASGITWTSLGTASFTVDAGTVREKIFLFGAAVLFKKIWFRVKLNGAGTDTPTLNDVVMNYLPIPAYKKQWTLNVNCADELKRLDGGLVETTARELKGRLERAWWTKSVLDFQDIDYATTLLNGALTNSATTITVDSTDDFPEQGRLHIDDEEITYTGKTPTTFTGCSRGARDTRAVSHSDNAVINNAYKVILTDLQYRVPIALEDRELEYVLGISLREV